MSDAFIQWLINEINDRGWANNELARRAGLSKSIISNVLSDKQPPTFQICLGISRAFLVAPEIVLRKAGLLPPTPTPEKIQRLIDIISGLSEEELDLVVSHAQWRYEQMRK